MRALVIQEVTLKKLTVAPKGMISIFCFAEPLNIESKYYNLLRVTLLKCSEGL